MASPNREQTADQFAHRLSAELFSFNPEPNYYPQQNPNPPPQNPSYYSPVQDVNYYSNPMYSGAGASGSSSSAQPQYSLSPSHYSIDEIQPANLPPRYPIAPSTTPTPDSSVLPLPMSETAPPEKRKRRSATPTYEADWWRFYEMTKDANGVLVNARCKVKNCNASYNYVKANGLSSFKKHTEKHIKSNEEPQEMADSRHVQTLINPDGSRTHQKYDERRMLQEFARYIAHKEQPISMGNCLSFARLIIRGCGQPLYKRFHHRKMVKELKDQYTDRKNELLAQFALANYKVSITSDIWTAGKHGLGYSCITAHYIDESWVLQKRVLSFRVLDFPHSAQIIYQSIINVLQEYNLKRDLENKIFSISFDNASNNIKSIDYFTRSLTPIMNGTMFHQKCACHILNLTVKAGLKIPAVDNLIMRFKQGLAHIFSNNVRKQEFAALCDRLGLSKLRVPWDIDTRWNSTYRMFHRCLPYKNAIAETLRNSSEGMRLLLSDGEWNQIVSLKNFLQSFFNATVKLSCSYTPAAHELLHHLYMISKVYRDMEEAETYDSPLQPIVEAMKEKFLKYWEEVPLVTIIANCLHPSFKKRLTIKMLQRYKNNLHLDASMEDARVNSALEEMFKLYNSRRNVSQPSSTRRVVRSSSSSGLLQDLQDDEDPQISYSSTNELECYCLSIMEPDSIDIMEYWKNNASAYPTLAMMARDIFAVPVSTVPSESCFSSANRILTDKRSKLGAKVFERLVCLKDWIDAENRMQHESIEATTSGAETQESGTGAEPEEDSDGACDPQEMNELWYMNRDF